VLVKRARSRDTDPVPEQFALATLASQGLHQVIAPAPGRGDVHATRKRRLNGCRGGNQAGESADRIHRLQGEIDGNHKRAPVALGGRRWRKMTKGLAQPPRSFDGQFECGPGRGANVLRRTMFRERGQSWRAVDPLGRSWPGIAVGTLETFSHFASRLRQLIMQEGSTRTGPTSSVPPCAPAVCIS